MLRERRARALLTSVILFWGVTVMAGFAFVHSYEGRPGETGDVQASWPEGSSIPFDPSRANLVLFAHPRCPCTRASIAGLARIMDKCGPSVTSQVEFFQPREAASEWRENELWRRASHIPGVKVQGDLDGEEADRFGAETSGMVFLYDKNGELLFHGGITAGRGQEGDNQGLEAVIARLSQDSSAQFRSSPVFGCSILDAPADKQVRGARDGL